jgi:ABC-type sugar transport system substrate-binding protein
MKTGSFTRVVALAVFASLTGTACGGASTSGTAAKTGAPYQVAFSSGAFTLNSKIANKIANKQALNFAISIEGTGIPIFGAAMSGGWQRGVDGVKSKYGASVNGQVIGPINTDVPAQVSQINSLLAAGQIDCLAFEAHEPGPYVDVINKAMKSGVPVFGVNADSPDSSRIAFYGPDELVGGTVAGTATGKWAKANNVTLTTAAVMTGSVEGPWAQNRMKGFITGIQTELPSLQFVNSPTQGIESQGFAQPTVYAKAKAYIAGHPNVQIIFHTDQGVEMVAKAINDLGLKGKVRTAGYNISPAIADYIKSGIIVVTMVQGFSRQAEAGAKACGDFLYGGKYSTGNVVISPDPVTPDNVASKDWTDPANQ